jgi:hypothetical protein
LPRLLAELPDRLDVDGRRRLVAWLLGRADELGAVELGPWMPAAPPDR